MAYLSCSSCGLSVLRPPHDHINSTCPHCGRVAAVLPTVMPGIRLPEFTCDFDTDRDTVFVRAAGELDLMTAEPLDQQLVRLLETGFRHVVVDLREVTFIDSSGIRLLVKFDERARRDGVEFALIQGPEAVQRVLAMCGVADCFAIREPVLEPARWEVGLGR